MPNNRRFEDHPTRKQLIIEYLQDVAAGLSLIGFVIAEIMMLEAIL